MLMKFSFYLGLILIFLLACNKNENLAIDKLPPSIDVYSPERNFVYSPKDTVFIKATFSDAGVLRTGSIHVHDQLLPVGQDTLFTYQFKLSQTVFELDTFCIVNDPLDKNYVIYFETTDRSENQSKALRFFHQYH